MPAQPVDVQVGDVVQTRKAHPCGSSVWQVYRIGADIGIRCQGCQRRVLLPRRAFNKAVKRWLSHTETHGQPQAPGDKTADATP
jgi:hypothetical protein